MKNPVRFEDKKRASRIFVRDRVRKLLKVVEAVWLGKQLGACRTILYRWSEDEPPSLPNIEHILILSAIESFFFEYDEVENFQLWLKSCGYEINENMVEYVRNLDIKRRTLKFPPGVERGGEVLRAYIKWLDLHGKEVTIKFPSLRLDQDKSM